MRELTIALPRPVGATALAGALRDALTGGRLCAGTRMPSTRALATDLGVSRGVVVEAYERLVAEGRLLARRGSGTVVAPAAAVSWALPQPAPDRTPPTRRPLRPGAPDLGLFPHGDWRRATGQALAGLADADLDYPDPAGAPRLRQELAAYLGRVRAALVDPACLHVTSGAAQAFALLAQVLRQAGVEAIGMEEPGPTVIRDHLARCGLRPVPVPVDDAGLDVAALARTRLRAVFITPAHQFPTGVLLRPHRREALVDWARSVGALIVEDDYDAEFRYDRDPVGCVQGLAPDVTALVGSVSKVLAPALRLGWLCLPPTCLDRLAAVRAASDLGSPVLPQLAFAELLAGGGYDRHIRRARRTYRTRRDAVVTALRTHLPQVAVTGVAAGMHLLARLPDGSDDLAIVTRAEAGGLGPVALSTLYARPPGRPGLVIGYAGHSPDQLATAVAHLAATVPPRSLPASG